MQRRKLTPFGFTNYKSYFQFLRSRFLRVSIIRIIPIVLLQNFHENILSKKKKKRFDSSRAAIFLCNEFPRVETTMCKFPANRTWNYAWLINHERRETE